MNARTSLCLSFVILLLAGCSKVSHDFKQAGDQARQQIDAVRDQKIDQMSTLEQQRDEIKKKLEVVTAATRSERERNAQAVLVSLYLNVSLLKEAQMMPPSEPADKEIARVKARADECSHEYDVQVGDARDSAAEYGPCLKQAQAAMEK
jgi:outer membrane murein-binding lipoprotein Lpp